VLESIGADETNRTSDLLITNQLLYRLSYISESAHFNKKIDIYASAAVFLKRPRTEIRFQFGLSAIFLA
jgi:hypothetical protein